MPLAIEAEGVAKHYGKLRALDNINLQVAAGEIFGFLGPNGAGKSTFVKVLLHLVRATAGSARIFGRDVASARSRAGVGFLPERYSMYGFMSIEEYLAMHACLADVPRRQTGSEVARALTMVGLLQDGKRRLATLSKGMLQRAGIAQALLGNPRLIFLDEPTSGLDPIWVRDLRAMLLNLKACGVTIFLNSHLLSEVERTCDRVAILNKGSIIRSGSRCDLSEKERHLELVVDGLTEGLVRRLDELSQKPLAIADGAVRLYPADESAVLDIHRAIVEHGGRLQSLRWQGETLEEVFYRLVKHEDTGHH